MLMLMLVCLHEVVHKILISSFQLQEGRNRKTILLAKVTSTSSIIGPPLHFGDTVPLIWGMDDCSHFTPQDSAFAIKTPSPWRSLGNQTESFSNRNFSKLLSATTNIRDNISYLMNDPRSTAKETFLHRRRS